MDINARQPDDIADAKNRGVSDGHKDLGQNYSRPIGHLLAENARKL